MTTRALIVFGTGEDIVQGREIQKVRRKWNRCPDAYVSGSRGRGAHRYGWGLRGVIYLMSQPVRGANTVRSDGARCWTRRSSVPQFPYTRANRVGGAFRTFSNPSSPEPAHRFGRPAARPTAPRDGRAQPLHFSAKPRTGVRRQTPISAARRRGRSLACSPA